MVIKMTQQGGVSYGIIPGRRVLFGSEVILMVGDLLDYGLAQ